MSGKVNRKYYFKKQFDDHCVKLLKDYYKTFTKISLMPITRAIQEVMDEEFVGTSICEENRHKAKLYETRLICLAKEMIDKGEL